MSIQVQYKFLAPRPGSNYRQFFLKDRKVRAEILYRATVGPEPRTPEQVARDFDVPLDAVLESIDYCTRNRELLDQERDSDWADIRARGLDKPPFVPPDFVPAS